MMQIKLKLYARRGIFMERYVEVFVASDITFAYLMKANLEAADIPAQIANENLQGAYCLDGMVPRVLVPEKYLERAKKIIEEIQQASENTPDINEQEDENQDFGIET
jgi:hypothetical protein